MKIGINGLYYLAGRMGGVETYLQGLLSCVSDTAHTDTFTFLLPDNYTGGLVIPDQLDVLRMRTYTRGDPRCYLNLLLNVAFQIDLYSAQLNHLELDVIHYPFTVLLPPVSHIPTVLTFHDMQQEFYPSFFSTRERLFRARTYRSSAKCATRLIAISEHVKQNLIDMYDVASHKIDVIYNGCSQDFKVLNDSDILREANIRYGLDRPFMYYPAATWPHKNHVRLLEALKLLVERYHFDGQLVLTGVAKEQNTIVHSKINELGLERYVRILGYLPYSDLPCIYNLARLLVFPSLFEGFGIPLVEAMACGCPVVAADCTSIPEVLAGAGLLFDPTSVEDIADNLWASWNDDLKLADMKQKGLIRAERFTWERAVKETVDVYHKAIG